AGGSSARAPPRSVLSRAAASPRRGRPPPSRRPAAAAPRDPRAGRRPGPAAAPGSAPRPARAQAASDRTAARLLRAEQPDRPPLGPRLQADQAALLLARHLRRLHDQLRLPPGGDASGAGRAGACLGLRLGLRFGL